MRYLSYIKDGQTHGTLVSNAGQEPVSMVLHQGTQHGGFTQQELQTKHCKLIND